MKQNTIILILLLALFAIAPFLWMRVVLSAFMVVNTVVMYGKYRRNDSG
ncbi:MAG: hypothetical protein FWG65_04370 [Turicibacter sp.]|nr:hypothetical protein [Turicibacter sp.]